MGERMRDLKSRRSFQKGKEEAKWVGTEGEEQGGRKVGSVKDKVYWMG
jgi:hypothetical protein